MPYVKVVNEATLILLREAALALNEGGRTHPASLTLIEELIKDGITWSVLYTQWRKLVEQMVSIPMLMRIKQTYPEKWTTVVSETIMSAPPFSFDGFEVVALIMWMDQCTSAVLLCSNCVICLFVLFRFRCVVWSLISVCLCVFVC